MPAISRDGHDGIIRTPSRQRTVASSESHSEPGIFGSSPAPSNSDSGEMPEGNVTESLIFRPAGINTSTARTDPFHDTGHWPGSMIKPLKKPDQEPFEDKLP